MDLLLNVQLLPASGERWTVQDIFIHRNNDSVINLIRSTEGGFGGSILEDGAVIAELRNKASTGKAGGGKGQKNLEKLRLWWLTIIQGQHACVYRHHGNTSPGLSRSAFPQKFDRGGEIYPKLW